MDGVFFKKHKWCTCHLGHLTIAIIGNMLTMWYWSILTIKNVYSEESVIQNFPYSFFTDMPTGFILAREKFNLFNKLRSRMPQQLSKCNYEFHFFFFNLFIYFFFFCFLKAFWWKHIWHLLWNKMILYSYSDPKYNHFQNSV